MLFRADAPFALVDGDDGSAHLLTDYRRQQVSVSADERGAAPAVLFADIEAASAAGEWVVLAADYGLGASFEVAARSP